MQRLSSRIWPLGWHPGGLGWWLGRVEGAPADLVVYRSGDELVGWASRAEAHEATIDVGPDQSEAAKALVEWIGGASVVASRDNHALIKALEAGGFAPAEPWIGLWLENLLPLRGGVGEGSPTGYSIRSVRPDEIRERVEVHRAAWLPAALPYHPDHRPDFPPDATSSFTGPAYELVRRTWLYDDELDLVAVAPDDSLAACCIGWFDPATGSTEIEPLGVHPDHRRQGLAGALCLEIAARTAARGGREVFINNQPSEGYPAPAAAYLKAGFQAVQRGMAFRRGDSTM